MVGSNVPVDVSDFKDLVCGNYIFADKSLLIKDIVELNAKRLMFTRPRRFGKSLAISMIDRYFNVAYRDEEKASDSFKDLKISEYDLGIERNSYPVLKMDMSCISFDSYESFKESLNSYVVQIIRNRYTYLLSSDKLDEYQKDCLRGYLREGGNAESMVLELCIDLTRHHGSRPIILMDEYDKPIEQAFRKPYFEDFMIKYGDFMRIAFKGNDEITFAVVMGVQRIVVDGLFSSMNNFNCIGVTDSDYSEYFGLTHEEVRLLIERRIRASDPSVSEHDLCEVLDEHDSEATEWYDGYVIGGNGNRVFNPYSVVKYLSSFRAGGYWTNTAEHTILKTLFAEVDESVLEDVKNSYVDGSGIGAVQVCGSTPLWKPGEELDRDEFLSLLVHSGYLTAVPSDGLHDLHIPNREVRESYNGLMERVFCFSIPRVVPLMRHIVSRDRKAVEEDIRNLMEGKSYLDGWSHDRYKEWLHDIFRLNGYNAITEREHGEGRTDLLIHRINQKPPVVIELKTVPSDTRDGRLDETMDRMVAEGLEQIRRNRYSGDSETEGAVCMALVFHRKTCRVGFL